MGTLGKGYHVVSSSLVAFELLTLEVIRQKLKFHFDIRCEEQEVKGNQTQYSTSKFCFRASSDGV